MVPNRAVLAPNRSVCDHKKTNMLAHPGVISWCFLKKTLLVANHRLTHFGFVSVIQKSKKLKESPRGSSDTTKKWQRMLWMWQEGLITVPRPKAKG